MNIVQEIQLNKNLTMILILPIISSCGNGWRKHGKRQYEKRILGSQTGKITNYTHNLSSLNKTKGNLTINCCFSFLIMS